MTTPIDVAYVDVIVRDKDLERLPKDIDRAAKKAQKNFDEELLDKIEDHFSKTMKKLDDDLEGFVQKSEKKLRVYARDARGRFISIKDSVTDLGDEVDNRFFTRIRRGFSNLTDQLSDFGRGISQIFSGVGGFVTGHSFAALIIALIPPIIALAAALSQLIGLVGLIPTGLVVLGATIAPLIIAFQNFGEAVSALASGDLEKIDEALKKLAPSARVVAREVASLIEPLKTLQRTVQQAFFTPLIGGFTQLNDVLIPTLTTGLSKVATAFGGFFRGILDFLALPEQKTFLDNLFNTVQRLTVRLGPSFIRFLVGFFETADRALPVFERISNVLIDMVGRFGDFLAEAARSGKLDKFIEDALTTLRELGDLLGATLRLIGTLFDATEEEGHNLIRSLTDMIIKLDDFLNTAEGKKTLEELIFLVKLFAASLEIVLALFISSQQTFSQFIEFLHAIGVAVTNFALINLGTLVRAAAAAFSWIPGLGPKLQKAADEFDAWAKDVLRNINELNGKTITINVKTISNAIAKGALGGIQQLADGALVKARPGGILANIGEGGEDEVIAPLSKLGDIAGGQSITFGPGSISVNFSGVVPTSEEAQQTGQAIGQGILNILARRNIRAQVRAI